MLETIILKFSEGQATLTIPARGVTIFVGPNNSGKSLILRELQAALLMNGPLQQKLLTDFTLDWPNEADFRLGVEALTKGVAPPDRADLFRFERFTNDGRLETTQVSRDGLFSSFNARNKHWVSSQFLSNLVVRLDGRTRFALTDDRQSGDLLGPSQNILARLFQDDDLRKEVRSIVYDAFKLYFAIDPLNGGQLRIRLSPTEPISNEQSLDKAARDFHSAALHIKDASDGVQAFVGILIAVLTGNHRLVLVDEPEAFLHPPLARKLGYQLASIGSKADGILMASTHSADFLIGCLQAVPNVRVVRLEYSQGRSRGKVIDSEALARFFKTPLMRSANVISALFHDGVVVTESDNDRAFYSEIYYRLAEVEVGYPSVLFVNAQNKQTIQAIMGPLRLFGVPCASIVDIDILKDGGTTWTGWLGAAGVPVALNGGLGQIRGDLKRRFEESGKDMKKDGGVAALEEPDEEAANELFSKLDEYGVFVTRRGELENWLMNLNIPGKKTTWTIAMLSALGSDRAEAGYVSPGLDDVWAFMRNIVEWIRNPARKGM